MPNWKKIITSGSDAQLNSLELNNGATGSFTGSFIGDGSQLTGITATSSPGGSDSQIQYNNGGTTSGATNFVYDDVNQRVGIGTTSPSSKLEVRSEIASHQLISINRASSNTAALYIGNDTNNDGVIAVNNGELRIGKDISGNFTEHIRINPSGNVGINTTSPDEKLEVNGRIRSSLGFYATGLSNPSGVKSIDLSYNDFLDFGFLRSRDWVNNLWRPLYFQASEYNFDIGNVGIGNTSPASKLEVTGNVAIGYTSAAPSNGMIVNGNVGIGTTSPSAKLDISGGNFRLTNSSTTQLQINSTGSGSKEIVFLNNGTISGFVWQSGPRLSAGGGSSSNSLHINISNGNVGISTTSPDEKLDVNGNIKLNNSLLSNQQNTDVDTGTETVATVSSSTYDGVFFDYVIKNGTNLRAGTVTAVHDGTNISFTETSTQDLGNTTDLELSVDLSGGSIRLLATASSNNWSIKTIIRAL